MNSSLKLTDREQVVLDRVLAQLGEQGVQVSNQRVLVAILRAAVQLPEEELVRLIQEGLKSEGADRESNSPKTK